MTHRIYRLLPTLALLLLTSTLKAEPVTLFGEDLNGDDTVRIATPNAMASYNNFVTAVGNYGTEDFETYPAFAFPPLTLNFGGTVTGEATGTMMTSTFLLEELNPTNGGRFPSSGEVYWEVGGPTSIAFSSPIQALGFFATDVGDQGGQLQLMLTRTDGMMTTVAVPHSMGTSATGAALFFGLYDQNAAYTAVSFGVTGSTTEVFGIDDLTVGTSLANPVPEPSTFALLGGGGLLLLLRRRMR